MYVTVGRRNLADLVGRLYNAADYFLMRNIGDYDELLNMRRRVDVSMNSLLAGLAAGTGNAAHVVMRLLYLASNATRDDPSPKRYYLAATPAADDWQLLGAWGDTEINFYSAPDTEVIGARHEQFRTIPLNGFEYSVESPAENGNLVVTVDSGLVRVRPTDEVLEQLPPGARPFAIRVFPEDSSDRLYRVHEDGWEPVPETAAAATNADQLLASAREAYREWLRARMRNRQVDTEAEAERRRVRDEARQRFERFVRREADQEQHVRTLPFLPHGLASSRRWGIEVESGGARGVNAPEHWRRIYDGSLRSAYDGYVEVQDFEPYDEEVTEYIARRNCDNDHNPDEEYWNEGLGAYDWRANPDYVDPADCELCGERTQVVRREPQTIHHYAQDGDCAEFVSPILTSMHSNGLEYLCEELSKRPQNNSAGVHVHVEADDLSDEQVATLVVGYDMLEPILEASYQRTTRRYCGRRSVGDVLQYARAMRNKAELQNLDVRDGDRYVTLNTTALNEHGTIEFRAMGPVYEYEYLARWAMLCRELVNLVAAGVTTKDFSKVRTWNDLTALLARYGKEYVRAAVYEVTGEVGEAPRLARAGQPLTTEAVNNDYRLAFQQLSEAALTGTGVWNWLTRFLSSRSESELVTTVPSGGSRYWAA